MKNTFINRNNELKTLNRLYTENKPKLIIMYGRRRVGKTALIQEFLKKNNGLYLVGRQDSESENLKRFSSEIAAYFDDPLIKANSFISFDALFIYLHEKQKERKFPIAIDEFPYLVLANKSLSSIMQEYWDSKLSKTNIFLILCGSSIAMMESLLGYKSPLYGRRTEQMLIEPMGFQDASEFFPNAMHKEKKIEYYSILGGVPAYLLEFDYNKKPEENIMENVLEKSRFLNQDVLFVLKEELQEPRNYFSILRAVASGKTKLNEIVNDTGLERSFVSKYLSVLSELHLIKKELPVTDKKNSRKGIYTIRENFFKFWFKFVHGNENYIEQGKQELLLKEKILPNLNSYVGEIFNNIALISISKTFPDYLFGRWWDRENEIDIVGLSGKNAILLEVKWSNLNVKEAMVILNDLKKKPFPKKDNVQYGIIAKSIEDKEILVKQGYSVFELDDI